MDVLVENTQINAGIPRASRVCPRLDTQSAETKVLVADGGTVVIGGIIVTVAARWILPRCPLLAA